MENPLEADVKLVVQTFAQKESFLFRDFSDVWRDLLCSMLFWHGYNAIQKLEVVEQLQRFSIQHLLNEEGSQYKRLGGLYLAYTFHSSQPCHPLAQIRVTLSEYESLNKYHSEIKVHKLLQADYILSTLKVHSAFSICYTPLPMCISRQKKDILSVSHLQDLCPSLDRVLKDVKVVMGTQVEEYGELKQSLSAYLPQHLLTASPVPQEIDKAMRQFTKRMEKLGNRSTSESIMESQNSD